LYCEIVNYAKCQEGLIYQFYILLCLTLIHRSDRIQQFKHEKRAAFFLLDVHTGRIACTIQCIDA